MWWFFMGKGNNNKFNEEEIKNRLNEKSMNKLDDNNNIDPYGYDFVPTIAHWTNIDEQREEVKHLEKLTKKR